MSTELPEWAEAHFPKSPEDAALWQPLRFHSALHQRVLCVAQTRIEGTWCAYCRDVPGHNHVNEVSLVLRDGDKMSEEVALVLFPHMAGIPYAR